jgi:tRNA-intron endonuclease
MAKNTKGFSPAQKTGGFHSVAKKKIRKKSKKTEKAKIQRLKAFRAVLAGERISSNSKDAFDLYSKSRLGEPSEGKIHYSLVEAAYLLEKKRIQIFEKNKKMTFNKFLEHARKIEANFWTRYRVFSDMRSRGYIVKTALKFGADFRVYDRGVKPGEAHAKWVLFPVYETNTLTWHEFAAKNRVAHSTRKDLLIAVVDDEGDVSYWEVKWTKP